MRTTSTTLNRSKSAKRKAVGIKIPHKTVIINAVKSEYRQLLETYPLTKRELEILQLIVDGCSNAIIASKLFITVGTVKTHVRNILNKLAAEDRTQAAVRALRSLLIASLKKHKARGKREEEKKLFLTFITDAIASVEGSQVRKLKVLVVLRE